MKREAKIRARFRVVVQVHLTDQVVKTRQGKLRLSSGRVSLEDLNGSIGHRWNSAALVMEGELCELTDGIQNGGDNEVLGV